MCAGQSQRVPMGSTQDAAQHCMAQRAPELLGAGKMTDVGLSLRTSQTGVRVHYHRPHHKKRTTLWGVIPTFPQANWRRRRQQASRTRLSSHFG